MNRMKKSKIIELFKTLCVIVITGIAILFIMWLHSQFYHPEKVCSPSEITRIDITACKEYLEKGMHCVCDDDKWFSCFCGNDSWCGHIVKESIGCERVE